MWKAHVDMQQMKNQSRVRENKGGVLKRNRHYSHLNFYWSGRGLEKYLTDKLTVENDDDAPS